MQTSLSTYRRKRDFKVTPEPQGRVRSSGAQPQFVIQRHEARQLHFDFRLELDGVLKSWAVPKGPSENVGERRLAVEVEDHPLDYAGFEGDIPAGQYGAGHVDIWDRGTWKAIGDPREGLRDGHLKFDLAGRRLRGRWALVRMKPRNGGGKNNWLLIRERDPAPESVVAAPRARSTRSTSRRTPMPKQMAPELATVVPAPPPGSGWIYGVKFDGYRLLARIRGDDIALFTRTGLDWSRRFPGIVSGLSELGINEAWIDGEAVAVNEQGKTDFGRLQRSMEEGAKAPVRFAVFDLLYHDGTDLRKRPLTERRALLKRLLSAKPPAPLLYSEDLGEDGHALLAKACKVGLEGLIAKRADSIYAGRRTRDWLKLKCRPRDEFVIGGFTQPRGTRVGLGALLLGSFDGGRFVYRGRVGTGLRGDVLVRLRDRLGKLETRECPFAESPSRHANHAAVHWVQPRLVAEIEYGEMTAQGLIRQGSFVGLREDKPAADVEKPMEATTTAPARRTKRSPTRAKPAAASKPEVAGIAISNPDRVIAESDGVTKLDVARYHFDVAKWLLPHVVDRPLAVIKCPGGNLAHCFFQRHPGDMGRVRDHAPDTPPYLHFKTIEDVIAAVQNGAFEFHSWGVRFPHLDRPDRITLDLDPDTSLGWAAVHEACELTRALLDRLELRWYLKTTGGKGLHFVLPLVPRYRWDEVKTFARGLATELVRASPKLFIATMSKEKRSGRVFVDYLRNADGATAVAAYSLRARKGLPVSMPIAWTAMRQDVRGAFFNVRNIPDILRRRKTDPWADYEKARQRITAAARKAVSGV
jgi:bifunctional non-homologous end joining protein LigD